MKVVGWCYRHAADSFLKDSSFILNSATHWPCSFRAGSSTLTGGAGERGAIANVKSSFLSEAWHATHREESGTAVGAPDFIGAAKL